jgi:SPP1 gp7 family putative phage head morphogenesis protein
MVKIVKSISVRRAGALARVEVIRAHANAQLDAFELLGIKKVGLKAEWHTAGDEKVCPKCKPLEGAVFTIAQARGLIPRHVNCRCCWLPIIKQRETYKRQVKKSLKLGAWDAASNID